MIHAWFKNYGLSSNRPVGIPSCLLWNRGGPSSTWRLSSLTSSGSDHSDNGSRSNGFTVWHLAVQPQTSPLVSKYTNPLEPQALQPITPAGKQTGRQAREQCIRDAWTGRYWHCSHHTPYLLDWETRRSRSILAHVTYDIMWLSYIPLWWRSE